MFGRLGFWNSNTLHEEVEVSIMESESDDVNLVKEEIGYVMSLENNPQIGEIEQVKDQESLSKSSSSDEGVDDGMCKGKVDLGCCDFLGKNLVQDKDSAKINFWGPTGAGNRPTTMTASGLNTIAVAPAQLTIFYGGSISVFDTIPAEKAREIMLFAAAVAAANHSDLKNTGTDYPAISPALTRSPSLQSTATALVSPRAQLYSAQKSSLCKLQAELPITRRNSLQRFFEKRRDRLGSKNPYPTPSETKIAPKPNLSIEVSPDADCLKTVHA